MVGEDELITELEDYCCIETKIMAWLLLLCPKSKADPIWNTQNVFEGVKFSVGVTLTGRKTFACKH